MKKEFRILVIEKTAADVVSINHQLRKSGVLFRSKRVDSEDAFRHELEHHCPDLIVSREPASVINRATILAMVRESSMSVPILFLKGASETAARAMSVSCNADEEPRVVETTMPGLAPAVQIALFGDKPIPALPHATMAAAP